MSDIRRPWDEATERSQSDAFGSTLYARTEEPDQKVVETVSEIAAERGLPLAQIALAWLVAKPGVTSPIVGATKALQLHDAIAALDVKLTADEVDLLEASYVPHPVLGHT